MSVVIAYGGGTNSVALCVRAVQLGLPVDAIFFADTGRRDAELPQTYAHIGEFSGWLVRHGMPPITVVRSNTMGGETLEENCIRLGRLPSKAYGFKACSERWKTRPCWRAIKEAGFAGGIYIRGIDADESHRCRVADPKPGWSASFPLVDWQMGRQECVDIIAEAGLPLPGKSACFFCPSAGTDEVRALMKDHPDLYARGVEIERNATAHRNVQTDLAGLGQSFSWESLADQPDLFAPPSEDDCGCYDGARRGDRVLAPGYCGSFEATVERGPGGAWPLARDWRGSMGPGWTQASLDLGQR